MTRRAGRFALKSINWALVMCLLISVLAFGSACSDARVDSSGALLTELVASDGGEGDAFGCSAGISGDTVVVGANKHAPCGNCAQGAAYVFVRDESGWSQQAELSADDGGAYAYFGYSVGIAGDTVVVGANCHATAGNAMQGSAYVFTRKDDFWNQQAHLAAGDGAAYDCFGQSVAVSGDTVIVGACNSDVGSQGDQGSAYVFVRSGTSWSQQARLTADDGGTSDYFGQSVAIDGDTAVIGAWFNDVGANVTQGAAYVFTRAGTTWSQQAKLTAGDGLGGDFFGRSVAVSGDTVVIGSWLHGVGVNVAQGSAYVFTRSGGYWTEQAMLTASDGGANDRFGYSVAIDGDAAVVGAAPSDLGASGGSAYMFTRNGSVWDQETRLTAADGALNEVEGGSVAISGDLALVGVCGTGVAGGARAYEAVEHSPTATNAGSATGQTPANLERNVAGLGSAAGFGGADSNGSLSSSARIQWGMNLSGLDFGSPHGLQGTSYIKPLVRELDYFKSKGMTHFRLGFLWERVQHSPYADLDPEDIGYIDDIVDAARARGLQVYIEPHNFGRYFDAGRGQVLPLGSPGLPCAAFADLWRKLAVHFEGRVWAYDLMNEPHDLAGGEVWQQAAQAAIDAIREVDASTAVIVPGYGWSSAHWWVQASDRLKDLTDPSRNLVYEAHQYYDKDMTGMYPEGIPAEPLYPTNETRGEYLLRPFVDWLRANGKIGLIGETNVPGDGFWVNTVFKPTLDYICANSDVLIAVQIWSSGPWWGGYSMCLDPTRDASGSYIDRPQMVLLRGYASSTPG